MKIAPKLNAPLPFFFHEPSKRVLYVAAGPCPFVFTIAVADLTSHAPVVNHGPVLRSTTHPFGVSTAVASLAEDGTRRGLADTTIMVPGALEETLTLWADFCDAVADRLNDGEELTVVLATTWKIEDGSDINLHDDGAASAAMAGA
jgi:hypothetical protein